MERSIHVTKSYCVSLKHEVSGRKAVDPKPCHPGMFAGGKLIRDPNN
ncbi:MAG: hypothetical protein U9Q91_00160 [Candidatus Marinimicrobia bacterium]|nr:hypothetical protein [Candidatus Neomarinimicrobiota bacterium]